MWHQLILVSYRFTAFLLVIFPIVLNFIYQGDVVTSLIIVPVSIIVLSAVAAYVDHRIENALERVKQNSTLEQSVPKTKSIRHRPLSAQLMAHAHSV
ncbi:hypothetical protein EYS14_12215 [Alteromonadaceae bacterium M269]|nr:hypothetical protein EYS14_12215 [Alteromonadaceae bacterium M269]